MPCADQVPVKSTHSTMLWPVRVVLIAGSTGGGSRIRCWDRGSQSGLAYRIIESAYRLRIPRVFAAPVLIGMTGIAISIALSVLTRLLLRRWHDSEIHKS
jgi:hypothetical protein